MQTNKQTNANKYKQKYKHTNDANKQNKRTRMFKQTYQGKQIQVSNECKKMQTNKNELKQTNKQTNKKQTNTT